jgi:hypothetical protein
VAGCIDGRLPRRHPQPSEHLCGEASSEGEEAIAEFRTTEVSGRLPVSLGYPT